MVKSGSKLFVSWSEPCRVWTGTRLLAMLERTYEYIFHSGKDHFHGRSIFPVTIFSFPVHCTTLVRPCQKTLSILLQRLLLRSCWSRNFSPCSMVFVQSSVCPWHLKLSFPFFSISPISSHHLGNYVSFSSLVCFFVRSSFNGNVVMCFRNWLHSPLQPLLMYYFLHAFYHFFDSREI